MSEQVRTYAARDNAGTWMHNDGSACPAYWASRPTAPDGTPWWCTEHQQHVRTTPAPQARAGESEGGGDE